jgi:hypothetical protein
MTEQARRGDWIASFTGKRLYPFDLRSEDVDVNDIIHSLSNQCRFSGHCSSWYSVAQHSVLVSLICHPDDALWGLLHDASEYVLCDIPSPLKRMPEFEPYRIAEQNVMRVICDVFGLPHEEPASVKRADKRMLATEVRDLTVTEGRGWSALMEPYEFHVKPWSPEYARIKFTSRFHELTMKRVA